MMPNKALLKLISLLLPVIIMAGCSNARYGNLQRGEMKVEVKVEIGCTRESEKEIINNESLIESKSSENIEQKKENREYDENNLQKNLSPNGSQTSISQQSIPPPDDSIEIDIEKETRLAEKYGKTGYTLSLVALATTFFIGVGPLIAMVGLVYSIIAFYKMYTYELDVKNSKKITTGLFINAALVTLFILLMALVLFLLLSF